MQATVLVVALTTLKFLSIGVSAISGLVGTLNDYRDERGKITPWGRIAVVGIMAGALIAAAIQTLEFVRTDLSTRRAAEAALEQSERTGEILGELERLVAPLGAMEVSIRAEIPRETELARQIVDRIETLLGPALEENGGVDRSGLPEGVRVGVAIGEAPIELSIAADALELSAEEDSLINLTGFDLSFFKPFDYSDEEIVAILGNSWSNDIGHLGSFGDYNISLGELPSIGTELAAPEIRLSYHVENRSIILRLRQSFPAHFARRSGAVESIPDLIESSLVAQPSNLFKSSRVSDADAPLLEAARRSISIRYVDATVSGRRFLLHEADARSVRAPDRMPAFVYRDLSRGLRTEQR